MAVLTCVRLCPDLSASLRSVQVDPCLTDVSYLSASDEHGRILMGERALELGRHAAALCHTRCALPLPAPPRRAASSVLGASFDF